MKLYHLICVSILLVPIVSVSLNAEAGLVTGPNARTTFENHRDSHLDMFIDFDSVTTGLHSTLPIGLLDIPSKKKFNLATKTFRWPLPEKAAPPGTPVAVLPYDFVSTPANHRLMGVTAAKIPDGQSKYEIRFNDCHDRVGLKRMWNTYSITRFYQQDRLLKEYRNVDNHEFVGYIADPGLGDCVTRIEFDGHPAQPDDPYNKLYMVGEVDDLFYSIPAVSVYVSRYKGKISPGDVVTGIFLAKNYGNSDIENPSIRIEYLNHTDNKTFSYTWHDTIYGADSDGYGAFAVGLTIETTKSTKIGYYKISASIHSSSGVLVDETTIWYYVGNPTGVVPSIQLLLLGD